MKALLVDDHNLVRHGLELLLTMQLGFSRVFHAENAAQAMACLEQNPDLDLVLLDYKLEDDNGLNVLARIKARNTQIPVAIMSGFEAAQAVVTSLGEGAAGFIPKSLTPKELAGAISKILRGDIFVPVMADSEDRQAVDLAHQQRLSQVAELARRIIRDNDPSRRIPEEEACEVTSALNSLLDEFEQDRSRLEALAFRDELTGVANRRMFMGVAESALREARSNGRSVALAYLDLDGFKELNDSFGHEAGDQVLVQVAKRLKANVREVDTVARIGGDEFILIIRTADSVAEVEQVVKRIQKAICEKMTIGADTCQLGVSIGVVVSDGHNNLEPLMRLADSLMYEVKKGGKNSYLVRVSDASS